MRILITAGPTREYVDDVRYLSNASSGRMGYAIAEAAVAAGHEVVLVSGPVSLPRPARCEFRSVQSSQEMLDACLEEFPNCDGAIAVAAVCDYRPKERVTGKMSKTGQPLVVEFVETPDVLAELGRRKAHRWCVGFALEAQNARESALRKLRNKSCNAIVLNRTDAIGADVNNVEVINESGETAATWSGPKAEIARRLVDWIAGNAWVKG
ncbi:MAG: phosphopantothenoylcysteine decarboxylase [Planctomycetales bacterium]|nr:phosphopantothenoylcysteine decarboxylase [Planctomycetales bacterium]